MISDFIDGNYEVILLKIYAIFLLVMAVVFSAVIDLIFGVRKAKKLGEYRNSELYRRSVTKGLTYLALMAFGALLDFANPLQEAQFVLFKAPLVSAGFAICLIRIEYISVKEKAENKLRRRIEQQRKDATKNLDTLMDLMDKMNNLKGKDEEN